MSQEKICIPCHQSYPSSFPECPYCFVGSTNVEKSQFEGTFLGMLPAPILKEVAMYLAHEIPKEFYEVRIDSMVSDGPSQTIHFKTKEDAVEFVHHSDLLVAGRTNFVTASEIVTKRVATDLPHAFKQLEATKLTKPDDLGNGIFLSRGSYDLREFGKKIKQNIKNANGKKVPYDDFLVYIKKAKTE